ncbi:MAG: hypothetical protein KAR20_20070 [Candidatus Heimdallarchaeota archaeon]|nr:hypothetical protein [Candidatus Heimdallarchaeota archaeon]
MSGKGNRINRQSRSGRNKEISEVATQEFNSVMLQGAEKNIEDVIDKKNNDIEMQKNVGLATQFVNRIYLRVREIKEQNPDIAAEIDMNEWFLKQHMKTIRSIINQLPEEDRELVAILVISGLHQMIDEQLVFDSEKLTDADAKEVERHRSRKISIKTDTDSLES